MSLLDKIRLKNTAGDEISKPTREKIRIKRRTHDGNEIDESKNLKELIPFKISRTIPNYRYAFRYNDTINTTIENLIIMCNNKWAIECDDREKYKEAYDYIIEKTEEWKLDKMVDNLIKYPMVDGSMFINRYLDNGSYKFRILGNDDKRFKWIVVRDDDTDEIIGFKQKAKVKKINGSWKEFSYDTLKNADLVDEEYNFDPEEIIYVPYQEEDGEGVSAIESCLDLAYMENQILNYALSACRNAGGFLGVEFGNADIDAGGLDADDIKEVTDAFELDTNSGKSVVGYPFGIKPNEIGNGNIPNYDNLLRLIQSKIRNNLLTPDSKFDSRNSNRSTAREQLNNNDTGLVVFINYLQQFVMPIINDEMIDKELENKFPNAVGHIKFKYVADISNEKELSEIGATVISNYPDMPTELILSTYYGRVWDKVEKYKDIYGSDWKDKIDSDLGKFQVEDGMGNGLGSSSDEISVLGQNGYNRSMHQKKKMLQNQGGKDKEVLKNEPNNQDK